ncbi:MAG TPA: alkaline phosphatase [Chthoniobacterales bacterium]|jgi:alkaline phosphatase
MKWRNQLLALFCLIVFAGLGILYFQHWVVQKPFGIILFIGQGLAPQRLAAARLYTGGADARLALDSLPHLALLANSSRDFAAPDQAAAATALATGQKVNNRALALDEDKPLTTLLELARARGHATGLVTDGKLTGATCAAFYAHRAQADDADQLAVDFAAKPLVDVAMGGGMAHLLPQSKGGERGDDRDLLLELRGNGFDVVRTRAELEGVPAWRRPKLLGAFAGAEMAFTDQLEARKDQPSLADMVRRAVELLQYNAGGYLLVVDASLMGKAAQENTAERTLAETIELDRAVATARRYGGPRSTVIVCGDVAIGGLSLNGFPFRKDSGIALLGLNSGGQPWLTWATGPHGARTYGTPRSPSPNPGEQQTEMSPEYLEPAAVYDKSALNTVDDVLALGIGPGSEDLQGSLDNTAVFQLIADQL